MVLKSLQKVIDNQAAQETIITKCKVCKLTFCCCCKKCGGFPCVCIHTNSPRRSSIIQPHIPVELIERDEDLVFWPNENPKYIPTPSTKFPPKRYRHKKSQPEYPRRYASVEIEVAGLTKSPWPVYAAIEEWKAESVHDGSLPTGGFEICTAPAKGPYFTAQINSICSALKDSGASVNAQCGLHVHIDSRDFSPTQILQLIKLYAKIETALFLIVPASRRRNQDYSASGRNYCERCAHKLTEAIRRYTENPRMAKYLNWGCPPHKDKKRKQNKTRRLSHMVIYDTPLADEGYRDPVGQQAFIQSQTRALTTHRYSNARYYALNLHSHFFKRNERDRRRGTIECRLAAGTIDPNKIIPWVQLWDNIVNAALAWPTKKIEELPADPFQALLLTAPTEDVKEWLEARKQKFIHHRAPPEEDY